MEKEQMKVVLCHVQKKQYGLHANELLDEHRMTRLTQIRKGQTVSAIGRTQAAVNKLQTVGR